MLAGLQKEDALWSSCLTDPDNFPWPETSGTSAFCYALAWGINQGLLDERSYAPVVRNAWRALTSAVDADGKLGWVQPAGSQPGRSSASDSYPYGVGLFRLAGSEVAKRGGK